MDRERSLMGYSPWGLKESDVTEQLSTHMHIGVSMSISSSEGFCFPEMCQSFIASMWWAVFSEMTVVTFPTLSALSDHGHSQQDVELFLFLLKLVGTLWPPCEQNEAEVMLDHEIQYGLLHSQHHGYVTYTVVGFNPPLLVS